MRTLLVLGLLLLLGACSKPQPVGMQENAPLKDAGRGKFLAYEHTIMIDTEEAKVGALADKLVAACQADRESSCTLLQSSSDRGRIPSAHIKLRARPAGILRLMAMASAGGQVASQETRVDDLAKPVTDSNKRLDMLRQYEHKLRELEAKAGNNLEALMKVSKELAEVQSELEQALGQNAHLMERINLDLLTIRIDSRRHQAFWTPVRKSLVEFGDNLSQGISSFITGMAYILPWLLSMLAAWLLGRKVWRRFKR